ncbi:cell surface glycoprotein MUC18 [Limanda limanda]|uniref:cell surface glycoprotein MUC18 n=1 Tax=Limanda limanda TaxID=27771 RepID=UPI0029C711C6|nr:cell surface glycoprotein MUC18 [Limanda limanda]
MADRLQIGLAWARVEVTMQAGVEAYLSDSAQIPCQYRFSNVDSEPSFVMIQWFVTGVGRSRTRIFYFDSNVSTADNNTDFTGRVQVTRDPEGTVLTIQDVQLSDEREFFCQVNGLEAGAAEGKTHLRVFAPPEAPVIEGVLTGISVTKEGPSKVASCEVTNGFPKPNITWYRNNLPLKPDPGNVNVLILTWETKGLYSVESTLEYKVVKEDREARFSCEVSFSVPGAIRTVESNSINITVHYPTTMVELWKEKPKGLVKEGDAVELHCQGDGNPLPTFIFSRGQEEDYEAKPGVVLALAAVSRKDSALYHCRPALADGNAEVGGQVQLTVHYLDPAVVVPKESEFMNKGESLTASCNALSSLKTSTVWYKDGKQVGKGNTLHLQDATYDTTGEYKCEVTVPSLPALKTNGSVNIIVQGGPQLMGVEQEVQLEEVQGQMINLSCEAMGHPLPDITWSFIGVQNWLEVEDARNMKEHMRRSVVSVKVTSDISAQCNASNEMGTEVKTFSIRAVPRATTTAPFSPVDRSGGIIVGIIVCLLLLAILGSVLYFLYKKGKIPCGRSGKQEISNKEITKDDIVVEMKTNTKTEETVLLKAVNGGKGSPNDKTKRDQTRPAARPRQLFTAGADPPRGSPACLIRPTVRRRQEAALPPDRCQQHELEMTPTVAQVSSWSLEEEEEEEEEDPSVTRELRGGDMEPTCPIAMEMTERAAGDTYDHEARRYCN